MKNGAAVAGTASKATLTPCTSRTPVVGDRVQSLGDCYCCWVQRSELDYAFPMVGETATVVEVDEKGDFQLQKKSGEQSSWLNHTYFGFVEDSEVLNQAAADPGTGDTGGPGDIASALDLSAEETSFHELQQQKLQIIVKRNQLQVHRRLTLNEAQKKEIDHELQQQNLRISMSCSDVTGQVSDWQVNKKQKQMTVQDLEGMVFGAKGAGHMQADVWQARFGGRASHNNHPCVTEEVNNDPWGRWFSTTSFRVPTNHDSEFPCSTTTNESDKLC